MWLESSGKAGAKSVTADRLITNHLSHLSRSRKPREPISKTREPQKKNYSRHIWHGCASIENNRRERITKLCCYSLIFSIPHRKRKKIPVTLSEYRKRDEKKKYTRYACNRATTRGKKGRDLPLHATTHLSIFFKDTVARSSLSPYGEEANQF